MGKKQSFLSGTAMPIILSIALAFTGLVSFAGYYKVLTIIAGAGCIYLLLRRDLTPLHSISALLFLVYIVISGLTRFWAISGKF